MNNLSENERLQRELDMVTRDRNEALVYIAQLMAYDDDNSIWEEATSFLCEHEGYEDTSKPKEGPTP